MVPQVNGPWSCFYGSWFFRFIVLGSSGVWYIDYQVYGPWIHDPWSMVHGPWCMAHDFSILWSRDPQVYGQLILSFMVHWSTGYKSWFLSFMIHELGFMVHGSSCLWSFFLNPQVCGTWNLKFMVHGSLGLWFMDPQVFGPWSLGFMVLGFSGLWFMVPLVSVFPTGL